MQLDFALRAARIHRAAHGVQIGKSEYPPAVVTQANAGVVQLGARHVYPHVASVTVFSSGVTSLSAGAGHCHVAIAHACYTCAHLTLHVRPSVPFPKGPSTK